MHACGHDGHMAMLLSLARLAAKKAPNVNIRLIFQPAEESGGGAEKMIAAGATKNLSEIYALHLSPDFPVGTLATTNGALFAGVEEFDCMFYGNSVHAAVKNDGADAIKSCVEVYGEILQIEKQYSKNNLIHIGKIAGGSARNIVADKCGMSVTLRYFDMDQKEAIIMKIAAALNKSDNDNKTTNKLLMITSYPPLINSDRAVEIIKSLIPDIKESPAKYVAEDFAFYGQQIDSAMCWLGIRDKEHTQPLHSDRFGFDEGALLYGVEFFSRLIYKS